jgi:hypothetical protein
MPQIQVDETINKAVIPPASRNGRAKQYSDET